MYQNQEVLEQG